VIGDQARAHLNLIGQRRESLTRQRGGNAKVGILDFGKFGGALSRLGYAPLVLLNSVGGRLADAVSNDQLPKYLSETGRSIGTCSRWEGGAHENGCRLQGMVIEWEALPVINRQVEKLDGWSSADQ
jgi:hypothetical protein